MNAMQKSMSWSTLLSVLSYEVPDIQRNLEQCFFSNLRFKKYKEMSANVESINK